MLESLVLKLAELVEKGILSVSDAILLMLAVSIVVLLSRITKAILIFLTDHKDKMNELTKYSATMLKTSEDRFSDCLAKHYEYVQRKCSDIESDLNEVKEQNSKMYGEVCSIKDTTYRLSVKAGK